VAGDYWRPGLAQRADGDRWTGCCSVACAVLQPAVVAFVLYDLLEICSLLAALQRCGADTFVADTFVLGLPCSLMAAAL